MLDPGPEHRCLGVEPGLVDGARPSGCHVQQPGPQHPVGAAGQVDHHGDVAAGAELAGPPHVLVDAEGRHALEPVGVSDPCCGFDLRDPPQGVPTHAETTGQRRDRGVVFRQGVDRPGDRPAGQRRPVSSQRMLLGERADRAHRFGAPEDPLAPHHHHRAVPERGVSQQVLPAPVRDRDHTAGAASLDLLDGLHKQVQLIVDLAGGEHPHALHAEHHCRRQAAVIVTVHVTGAFIRSASWSLRILRAPALSTCEQQPPGASPNHPQRRRAPCRKDARPATSPPKRAGCQEHDRCAAGQAARDDSAIGRLASRGRDHTRDDMHSPRLCSHRWLRSHPVA